MASANCWNCMANWLATTVPYCLNCLFPKRPLTDAERLMRQGGVLTAPRAIDLGYEGRMKERYNL